MTEWVKTNKLISLLTQSTEYTYKYSIELIILLYSVSILRILPVEYKNKLLPK